MRSKKTRPEKRQRDDDGILLLRRERPACLRFRDVNPDPADAEAPESSVRSFYFDLYLIKIKAS
jgi:hypothetical protein